MMKKIAVVILSLSLLLAIIYFSKVLVTASFLSFKPFIEVEHFDILDWQAQREAEILQDYSSGTYSIEQPYVIVDPYQMNPLSALVIFDAPEAGLYTLHIQGHEADTDYVYTHQQAAGRVELAILGLYSGEINSVFIEFNGTSYPLSIQTEALPNDFQSYQLMESKPEAMADGMTLMIACFEHSYTAIIDAKAEVRAYFSNQRIAHGTSVLSLENGHFLVTGDEYRQIPYTMTSLWEINALGKIFVEYEVPNGVHHDMFELDNGNILAASNAEFMFESGTREDVAIILDRTTGEIIESIDLRSILDENRAPFHHFDPGIENVLNIDWFHMNTAVYAEAYDLTLLSSPIQSQVVALNSEQEIEWILGPHEGYEGFENFEQYLLEPIGEDFEWSWGQHHPMVLEDQDNNPNTLDLLLFDNGQNRSFDEATAIQASDNYSRAVQYRIDPMNMTIEQIWTYGKERGTELYSTFLGDADYLSNSNVLITFGGHLTQEGEVVDEIIGGVVGTTQVSSSVVEVNPAKEVVFEVHVSSQAGDSSAETYQAERIELYRDEAYQIGLSESAAQRLGNIQSSTEDTLTALPNFFFGDMDVKFNDLVIQNEHLIVDGELSYQDRYYLLSQAKIVLRSFENTFIFNGNSALNGRFFANIDLSTMPAGSYQVQIVGGVKEGNDILSDQLYRGYFGTDYIITLD